MPAFSKVSVKEEIGGAPGGDCPFGQIQPELTNFSSPAKVWFALIDRWVTLVPALSMATGPDALSLSTNTSLLFGFDGSGITMGSTFGEGIAEVSSVLFGMLNGATKGGNILGSLKR